MQTSTKSILISIGIALTIGLMVSIIGICVLDAVWVSQERYDPNTPPALYVSQTQVTGYQYSSSFIPPVILVVMGIIASLMVYYWFIKPSLLKKQGGV
jgi:hypothetical protein